jgi:peptidoglycan/LPS O-acetylase OafA/YrhL
VNHSIKAPKTIQQHRFHLLDGMRGIAAAMVFFIHAPGALAHCFPNGYLAVDLFFCLSGFVVAFSYEHRLMQKLSAKDFFVLRLIRFYPLYILGTILLLLRAPFNHEELAFIHSSPGYFVLHLLLAILALPRFAMHSMNAHLYPFNPPAWSLLAEMIANIGYALAIRKKVKWILLPSVCMLAFARLLFSVLHDHTLNVTNDLTALARVCFSFPVGVFLYSIYRKSGNFQRVHSRIAVAIALLTTILALSFHNPIRTQWLELLVITAVFPSLVYFAANVKVPLSLIWFCVLMGDISYPVYMLQGGMRIPDTASVSRFGEHHLLLLGLLVFADLLILGIGCWLLNRYYDEPARKKITAWYKARMESSREAKYETVAG